MRMLSYRHAFHAGNHADVLKHWVQVAILHSLAKKEKPYLYFDTHSGAGMYSLVSDMAKKTGEHRDGIGRLSSATRYPEEMETYFQLLGSSSAPLKHYFGSPAIAQKMMRPQDKAVLCELHPSDFNLLSGFIGNDSRFNLHKIDGYKQLKASLPHPLKRGLVLIDPSYEVKGEYQDMGLRVKEGLRRCATMTYAIWYPVVERHQVNTLINSLKQTEADSLLRIELSVQPDSLALSGNGKGMTGSGMLIINPPWQLEEKANVVLPWLVKVLSDKGGSYVVDMV